MNCPSKEYRDTWKLAQGFPVDKESVYPEHAVVQEFDRFTGRHCLEYGCGGGSDVRSLLRRGHYVWFVGIVAENVELTRLRILSELDRMRAFGVVLDRSDVLCFDSEMFDMVTSHGVLHHIENVAPVVAELARVLKPGGLMYAMLYTEHLERKHDAHARRLMRENNWTWERAFSDMTDRGTFYARAYTENEGRALFEGAGLGFRAAPLWNGGDFRTFQLVKP